MLASSVRLLAALVAEQEVYRYDCRQAKGSLDRDLWRSEEQPDGFEHLTGTNKLRVESANVLYQFITKLCLNCIARSLIVCIENPRQSLYWRNFFLCTAQRASEFHSTPSMCLRFRTAQVDSPGTQHANPSGPQPYVPGRRPEAQAQALGHD